MTYKIIVLIACIVSLEASARLQIRRVGSSTIAPLTQEVANTFVKETNNFDPLITSNGSGAGIKDFCTSTGPFKPDIVDTSRPMSKKELETCFQNGVTEITKVFIGKNGLCFLTSIKALQDNKILNLSVTPKQIFLATIKDIPTADGKLIPNTYKTWNEIDPTLPKAPIKVLVSPSWHGTRGDFESMVLEPVCDQIPWIQQLKSSDAEKYKKICHDLRTDTVRELADSELSEDAGVLVDELGTSPLGTISVAGCNILMAHKNHLVKALAVNKINPTAQTLKDGTYPLIYSLQIYIRNAHLATTKALQEYLQFYSSPRIIGPDGMVGKHVIIPVEEANHPVTVINAQNPNP